MFYRYNKPNKPKKSVASRPIPEGLTLILSATTLISDQKRTQCIQSMRDKLAFDDEKFDTLILNLIEAIAEQCQSLPDTSTRFYTQTGGLFDLTLYRADIALSLFQHDLLSSNPLTEAQSLWAYVLLSATLLKNISQLGLDYDITLYSQQGQRIKSWNPLIDDIKRLEGCFYDYQLKNEDDAFLQNAYQLYLARQLMPNIGFEWIASDQNAFRTWLALLQNDYYTAGTLGAFLDRAEALAIQKAIDELMAKNNALHRKARTGRFTDMAVPEDQLGMAFIQWLNKQLSEVGLVIGVDPLHLVAGGLLISDDLFKAFTKDMPQYKPWQTVQKGFMQLNLHQLDASGHDLKITDPSGQEKGLVFNQFSIALPPEVHMKNISTGKVTPVLATELAFLTQFDTHFTRQNRAQFGHHLPKLSASGEWLTPEPINESPSVNPTGLPPHG